MQKRALSISLLLVLAGCRDGRPTEVIQLAEPPAAPKAKSVAPTARPEAASPKAAPRAEVPPPPPPPAVWSAAPPFDGKLFQLERVEPRQLRIARDAVVLDLPLGEFSECVDEIPTVAPPDGMAASEVRERPVWLALQGDGEAASLRLSTRSALLVIDDGCMRVADVTTTLLRTRPDNADPIFALEQVAPDEAYDADGFRFRRRGPTGGQILHDKKAIIDLNHFNAETMFTARAHEGHHWLRMLMSREWRFPQHDGYIGREHTLVWALNPDGTPTLVMENDYRYGNDDSSRAETVLKAGRAHNHPAGQLAARGERSALEFAAVRVRDDKCPAQDSPIAVTYDTETVAWTFTPVGASKPVSLGKARLDATFATDCLPQAREATKRRGPNLTKRASQAPVRWKQL